METESHNGEGLRSHFQKVITDWVTSEKMPFLGETFEKVTEGKEYLPILIEEAAQDSIHAC